MYCRYITNLLLSIHLTYKIQCSQQFTHSCLIRDMGTGVFAAKYDIHTPESQCLEHRSLSKTAFINPLMPNDPYSGHTAPLTSKRCILYIYSTDTGTEYFKHGIYCIPPPSKCSLFHNFSVFGSCFIHILYTECAKI